MKPSMNSTTNSTVIEVRRILGEVGYEPHPRSVLTAWFETHGDSTPTPAELRQHLSDRVAAAAIPAAFVRVESLPQTANGKLDTAALPAPRRRHRPTTMALGVAETDTERTMVETWERVLRIEPIGVGDHFFELGGDSLGAIEVAFIVGERLGRRIPEELVFTHPTLRELCGVIDELAPVERGDVSIRVGSGQDEGGNGRLSAGERHLLLDSQLGGAASRYHVGRLFEVNERLDPDRIREAALKVVDRHQPLHTTFATPRRRLKAHDALEFHVIDAPTTMHEVKRLTDDLHARPLDLAVGPLVRLLVAPLESGGSVVVTMLHHVSAQGDSMEQLWREIATLYLGNELAPLPYTYADHADALDRFDADGLGDHWRTLLDVDWCDPLTNLRSAPGEPHGYIERSLGLAPESLNRSPGPTTLASGLAAIAATVRPIAGKDDLLLGVIASLRHRSADQLVGYFLNVLPVPISARPDDTLASIGAQSASRFATAFAGRHYPAASMIADARATGRPEPRPTVMVVVEEVRPLAVGRLAANQTVWWGGDSVADLTVFLLVNRNDVSVGLEYRGTSLTALQAEGLLDGLVHAFQTAAHAPSTTVRELAASRSAHLTGPDLIAPGQRLTIPTTSDVIAVSCGDESITYTQLDERVAARATALVADGFGAGDVIPVQADRSIESIVTFLAAWSIGAAYAPIDPTAPSARQQLIIDQVRGGRRFSDTAYVLFTSGSTGVPRGVAVSHHTLATSTAARTSFYGDAPATFLVVSSLGFDSSVAGLFGTLASGGTVVLPTDAQATNPDELLRLFEGHAVERTLLVPSLYDALLDRGAALAVWPDTVIVAGEACQPSLVQKHFYATCDV